VLYKADVVRWASIRRRHLEFARETGALFNYRYNTNVLVEPQMRATEIPKGARIDGQQSEQEPDNHIELAATPEETTNASCRWSRPPNRIKRSDPRQPGYRQTSLDAQRSSPPRGGRHGRCWNGRQAGIGCVQVQTVVRQEPE